MQTRGVEVIDCSTKGAFDPPGMRLGNSTKLLLMKRWTALHGLDRQMSQRSLNLLAD
jgi:hypothetical protein